MKFKIGTRQSDLALTQTRLVHDSLNKNQHSSEIVKVVTTGDKDLRAFEKIPGDGFFTKELEKQLLQKKIDLAVHSCKDLPSMVHLNLPWVAYHQRESVRDILITPKKNISPNGTLKEKMVIGTASPRRHHQLQSLFPTCSLKGMRGNVPTRIEKALSSEYDASILAEAGLSRLNLLGQLESKGLVAIPLETATAPCQGILAVQMRQESFQTLRFLENVQLSKIAKAEKSLLALFGGGCQLALGANITEVSSGYHLNFYLKSEFSDSQFQKTYLNLSDLLRCTFSQALKLSTNASEQKIWLTQPLQHQMETALLFKDAGLETTPFPLLDVQPNWKYEDFQKTADDFKTIQNLVFTSRFGVRLFFSEFISCFPELYDQLDKMTVYCIGESTKSEFSKYSDLKVICPPEAHGDSLFEVLSDQKTLLTGTEDSVLKKRFEKSGRNYTFLNLYKGLSYGGPLNDFTSAKKGDRIIITSPKAARIYAETYHQQAPQGLQVYAFGPTTSKELEARKVAHSTNSNSGSWESMIDVLKK